MTKHPYLNPTNDPKKEAFWDKAAEGANKRVTEAMERVRSVQKMHETPVVRPPSEYWDTRRKLGTRRKDQ